MFQQAMYVRVSSEHEENASPMARVSLCLPLRLALRRIRIGIAVVWLLIDVELDRLVKPERQHAFGRYFDFLAARQYLRSASGRAAQDRSEDRSLGAACDCADHGAEHRAAA